jgi:hypothetical protein
VDADVAFYPGFQNGLGHFYEQNAANFFTKGYFEPLEIDGYPAAYHDIIDLRSKGNCSLAVGVSDKSTYNVLIQWQPGNDACKAAENVAKAVLTTIQKGQ